MYECNDTTCRLLFLTAEQAVEYGSKKYYLLCGIGGAISCGLTHTAVVPLDLVKCRLQVNPDKYKNIFHGFKVLIGLKMFFFLRFHFYKMAYICSSRLR